MKSKVIQQIKEQNKELVRRIKEHKREWFSKPHRLCWEFRHRHIAYCLVRGRTMEQIETPAYNEQKRIQNAPDKSYYETFLKQFTEALEKERSEAVSEGEKPNA